MFASQTLHNKILHRNKKSTPTVLVCISSIFNSSFSLFPSLSVFRVMDERCYVRRHLTKESHRLGVMAMGFL